MIYDPAGNEQQVGASTFVYSPRNYLDQGDGLRYVYDGSGIRVAQVGLSVGPLITQQPLSQPVCPGSPVTLSVVASGATAYQWQSFDGTNWNNISGATAATALVTATATTQYRVVVSNAAASTTSNAVTITPVAVATEPASGILYGDVNHDGVVDGNDVALLRSALAGTATLAVPTPVADLNGDGHVDAVDLSLLGAYAAHTIACLPDFITVASANALRATAQNSIAAPSTPTRHPELAEPRGRWLAGAAQRSEGPQNAQSMFVASPSKVHTDQTAPNPTQYFFYTPEKNLLSTSAIQAAGGQPPIAIDYIWFAGHPVAEERLAPSETRYTFTDHLGTPFLQTDATGTPVWRIEYEPYGAAWKLRTGHNADQRLRFPGQEYDEETPEREYNIFRWYDEGWGQYTQSDPLGLFAGIHSYRYGFSDPVQYIDETGLFVDPTRAIQELQRQILNSCETFVSRGPKPLPPVALALSIFLDAAPASSPWERTAEKLLRVPFPSKCVRKCQENNCPPCDPPVGTIGYAYHKVPPEGTHDPHPGVEGNHLHYYQRLQIPSNCDCWWHNLHIDGPPPPVPDSVPVPNSDPWP